MVKINFENQFMQSYEQADRVEILELLEEIKIELKLIGLRERTIKDYSRNVEKLCKVTGVKYVDELNRGVLLSYVGQGDASPATRKNRLRSVSAILIRIKDRGLIDDFWSNIKIKVPYVPKDGTTEKELMNLLSKLNFNDFSEFRDACIYLTIWETGFRIGTIVGLTERMFDLEENMVHADATIMKNHRSISLPISSQLSHMLKELCRANKEVRKETGKDEPYIFLTFKGNGLRTKEGSIVFGKRTRVYRDRFGIKNITPHAVRRGFARRLLDGGMNVAMISRALDHSDLKVTTRYLNISNEEVIESLRKFNK